MAFDRHLLSGIDVLRAVVEARSFVRAGEALGLTQSGISRAVARLEQRLGIRLFDRTSRAVTLTDDGRRFHERVAPLLAGLEDATVEAGGAAATVRGRLRVNVHHWFAPLVLGPRLPAFMAAHPDLALELVIRDSLGDLVSEGFDAAVQFGEPEPSGLTARQLLETRILTCAAPAYLARHGRPAHPSELADGRHECMHFRDPRSGRPYPWEFQRGKRVLQVNAVGRLVLNDPATFLAACLAGQGVAQMMELAVAELLGKELIELFPDWSDERFPLYLLFPSRRLLPAKLRAFSDFVQVSVAESVSPNRAR